MSQPKSQLDTFRAWAGKVSDIRWATRPRSVEPISDADSTGANVGKVTTSHRTTLTSAVGSFKGRRSPLGLSPAPLRESLRGNPTIAFLRPKTPSPFSSTGNLSPAQGTAEPQFIPPLGPHRKTQAFILLSTSTIWQKRSAFYRHQF